MKIEEIINKIGSLKIQQDNISIEILELEIKSEEYMIANYAFYNKANGEKKIKGYKESIKRLKRLIEIYQEPQIEDSFEDIGEYEHPMDSLHI